jgi:hypothetical protein
LLIEDTSNIYGSKECPEILKEYEALVAEIRLPEAHA